MTIESTIRKKIYVGDGVSREFPIPFSVAEEAHIYLLLKKDGVSEEVTSNYSVDLDNSLVTYPVTGVALSSAYELTIYRDTPHTQIVDLENSGAFHPQVLEEDGFDRIVMQVQEIAEEVNRSVKVAINATQTPEELLENIFTAEQNAIDSASSASQSEANALESANSASQSEENAQNYADKAEHFAEEAERLGAEQVELAKNWAIGSIEDNEDGSAKYWAEQALETKNAVYGLSVSWNPIDSDDINTTQGSVTYDEETNALHFNVPRGPQGIQGVAGADGKDGEDGADGVNGTDGADGADGKSAYDIWLDAGNEGTEVDFLASLKGADGADGQDGADGVNGADGLTPTFSYNQATGYLSYTLA